MDLSLALAIFGYIALLLSISLHDAAQAWMANRLGDPTARMLGRLTMNPLKHFDILGTGIWPLLFLFGMHSPMALGWGKPVPITTRNLKKYRDEMLIFAAGPAAQLLAAIVCLVVLVAMKHLVKDVGGSLDIALLVALHSPMVSTEGLPGIFPVVLLLYFGLMMNLLLCVFNLIPLPALDGGKVLRYYLPLGAQQAFDQASMWLMIGFFFIGGRIIMAAFMPLLVLFQNIMHVL